MMRWELAEPGIQIFTGLAQMVYGVDDAAAASTSASRCTTSSPPLTR